MSKVVKKYKDAPRHKAVVGYEDAFKKDFRTTVKAAVNEVAVEMLKMVST